MKISTDKKQESQDKLSGSVLRQIAVLPTLNMEQLKVKWRDLNGSEPPDYKRGFIIKRLAYRIQELFYGGLAEEVKANLQQVAQNDPVATIQCRMSEARRDENAILSGTRLVRIWKDRRYEVIVHPEGFEMNGRMFRSLSAIANDITGTKWNGKIFFGLKQWNGKVEGFKNV